MKVLYLTDSLSDLDGVGRYAIGLIEACERQRPGLAPRILLARKHRPTSALVPPHWPVKVALPPDYFYYMSPLRFLLWRVLGTLRVWWAARRVDLVHAIKDYPHTLIAVDGARLAGKPCVATGHGTYTLQPVLSKRHGSRARKTFARLASLISVSRYTRRRLLEALPPGTLDGERVIVVPNCVDAARMQREVKVPPWPWQGAPFTLTIGEVKERKGHHLGLQAFLALADRFPSWQHVIVGRCSGDPYEASLRAMAKEAGCAGRVHFLGNVSEDQKIDLVQRCEIFLHTPVTAADGGFEGFGIVYLEASAVGRPVLGTLDCGAEDAIVHDGTGLLVDQTKEAVQAALARLMGDASLRQRMGARGREHALQNTWDENARAVLEIYDRALHEGAR